METLQRLLAVAIVAGTAVAWGGCATEDTHADGRASDVEVSADESEAPDAIRDQGGGDADAPTDGDGWRGDLPDDADLDTNVEADQLGDVGVPADAYEFFDIGPVNLASDCPDLPRLCFRIHGQAQSAFPALHLRWVPESLIVLSDETVRIRGGWMPGRGNCQEIRPDILPIGWISFTLDITTLETSDVEFDPSVQGPWEAEPAPESAWAFVIDLYYTEPDYWPCDPIYPPKTRFEEVVGEHTIRLRDGCGDAADIQPSLADVIEVEAADGSKSFGDLPFSLCHATEEQLLATGCVCEPKPEPPPPPLELKPDQEYVYFELDGKPYRFVAIGSSPNDGGIYADEASGSGGVGIRVDPAVPPLTEISFSGFSLYDVPEGYYKITCTAEDPTCVGFVFYDGGISKPSAVGDFDYYTSIPLWVYHPEVTGLPLTFTLTVTSVTETHVEGTFEGDVAPYRIWSHWNYWIGALTQDDLLGPPVRVENGQFRAAIESPWPWLTRRREP